MRIYEQNYRLLLRLVPNLDDVEEGDISSGQEDAMSLHLSVLERNSYTVTVHLTYLIPKEGGGFKATPDLQIRLYHDAKVAEVYLYNKHGQVDAQQFGISVGDSEITSRCKINAFLEKWLAYCVSCGHQFSSNVALTS